MRWHISLCLALLVPALAFAQTPDEKKATIKYLQALQNGDGGFLPAPQDPNLDQAPRSSLRATSAAIRAIKYFGGEVPDREKAAKFVARCFDANANGFADMPQGMVDVFSTAVGVMAATELNMPNDPYASKSVAFLVAGAKNFEDIRIAAAGCEAAKTFPDAVTNWLEKMAEMRNADGSYGKPEGDARMTGSVVALILRVGGRQLDDKDLRAKSLAVMVKGQQPDGGFAKPDAKGSDLETTYRVMRAFHMLKEKPKDVEKLKSFIAKCRNADGGYGAEPGKESNVGGTYYAGIILYWLK